MTFVIIKATVGYIVRPNGMMHMPNELEGWAAFDSWEQASAWIGEQFRKLK